jgi:hypothetical protein
MGEYVSKYEYFLRLANDYGLNLEESVGQSPEDSGKFFKAVADWMANKSNSDLNEIEWYFHYFSKREIGPISEFAISEFQDSVDELVNQISSPAEGHRAPAPPAQSFGVSARGAEELVSAWMEHLGYPSAMVTPYRRDGGIDVSTRDFDIQVKNWDRDYIPVSAVRELYGVASANRKRCLFFSRSSYSADSIDFANKVGMGLFLFDAESGTLSPVNTDAKYLIESSESRSAHLQIAMTYCELVNNFTSTEWLLRRTLIEIGNLLLETGIADWKTLGDSLSSAAQIDSSKITHDNCWTAEEEVECLQAFHSECIELLKLRRESGALVDAVFEFGQHEFESSMGAEVFWRRFRMSLGAN